MKTVLVTGASGGFGIEFAIQLEQQGYALLLHGRDKARLKLTLDALEHPKRHSFVFADLSSRKETEDLIDSLVGRDLYGLVNNAGFGVWGGFSAKESIAQADVIRVDLLAPVMLAHALLPCLIRNKGFMINVSSLAAETPLPYLATYAAVKAGMTFWSEAIRAEHQGEIRVVTLAPGPSPTGFRDVSGAPKGKGSEFSTPASKVVCSSLQALASGGGYCVPGWRHKLLWLIQKLTPRFISLSLMASYLKK
ncbi:MAG: SDR family NAD(P)-dependent oxidoreductase [Ghiorsea sp.]|nr:SDR family NAD(P)-dependent oxidoreductase [Ghiorsea sp.]MDQ6981197.1 SDR family NAD(P)-dependent oxidoreductase [Ghiorsea sp.]MDQ7057151.1 SDR family NAD(P)-dependent oxidoreductase [Ghiorsea sp.]